MLLKLLRKEQVDLVMRDLAVQLVILPLAPKESQQHRSADQKKCDGQDQQTEKDKEKSKGTCAHEGQNGSGDGDDTGDQSISSEIDPK